VAELLSISCACRYEARVADGGLFAGVAELFVCDECREVVDILVWSSGFRGKTRGSVEPVCPRCSGTSLRQWRDGEERAGPCPRCGRITTVTSIGIAD
jgi:hypothetical protein